MLRAVAGDRYRVATEEGRCVARILVSCRRSTRSWISLRNWWIEVFSGASACPAFEFHDDQETLCTRSCAAVLALFPACAVSKKFVAQRLFTWQ